MNPDTPASTSRLPPLQLSTSQVAFDDRAAAAALLQIKLSPSSAHSPLPPAYTAPQHSHPPFYPPLPSFHHYSPPIKSKPTQEQERDSLIDVENDDPVRCICGFDADDGFTIQCDRCHVWQHAACVGIDTTDAAPDVYFCEQCGAREGAVDYERARKVQSERMALAASYQLGSTDGVRFARVDVEPTTKKRARARRRLNTHTPHSPPPAPQASPPPPAPSPSTQYVPLTRNIVAPSVRPLLRNFAHSYRGVTALTSPPLSPLALSTPLPAPPSTDDDKTFLTPLPPIHPSRPPSYTLRALKPIARKGYVAPYTCSVTPAAAYLAEPSSQYAQLGIPKQGVHLLPPPLALCLDARTAGGKTRWVRSGCRPNAVLRPVICGERKERADVSGKENGETNGNGNRHENENKNDSIASNSNSHPNGEADAGDDASDSDHQSGEEEVTFGVFALRDLKAHEEIVLGWEWDDRHVVHELPKMMKGGRVRPGTSLAMSQVLATLCSTFTTCACGASARGCALAAMERFAEQGPFSSDQEEGLGEQGPGVRQRTSHERTHTPPDEVEFDLGPLVGVRRGLGTRVVGGAGGREGVSIVEDGVGPMQNQNEKLLDGRDGMRRTGKRRRPQEERDDPEEMLPPKMRKMWIKETLRVLNGTTEEEKEEKEALQSPSTAMAGLSLRARDSRSPLSPFAPTQIIPSPTGKLSPSTAYHTIPSPSEHASPSSPSYTFPFPSVSPSSPRPNARAIPSPVSPGLPTPSPSVPNFGVSYPTQIVTPQSPQMQQQPSLTYSSSDIQSFSSPPNSAPPPSQPSPIQVTAPSPPSPQSEASLSPSRQPASAAVPPSPSDHEPNALSVVFAEHSHESIPKVSSSHALHEPMSSSPPRESTSLPAQDPTPSSQHTTLRRNPTPPLPRERTPPLLRVSAQVQPQPPQPPQDTTPHPLQTSPREATPPPRIPTPPPPTPAPRPQPTLRRRTLADWKRDRERLAKEQSLSGSGKVESGANVDGPRDGPKVDVRVDVQKVDERGDVGKDNDVEMQDEVGVVNYNDDRDRDVKMDGISLPVSDPPSSFHLPSSQPNSGAAGAIDVKMETQMDVPSLRAQADVSPSSPRLDSLDRLLSDFNAGQPYTTRPASSPQPVIPPTRPALSPLSPTLSRPALSSQAPKSHLPTRHTPASRFDISHSPPPSGELDSFNPTPRLPPPTRSTPSFPARSPSSHGRSPPSRPRSPPSRPRSPPTRPRFLPGSAPPPRAPPRGPRALRTHNGGGGSGPSGGYATSRGRPPPAPPPRGAFYPPAVERDRDRDGDRGRGGRGGR